eukprot:gene619-768_t
MGITELSKIASMEPWKIVEKEHITKKYLPLVCSEISEKDIEKCEGSLHYKPVITPGPVLDPEKMDYTIKPCTATRAKFAYSPDPESHEAPIVTVLTPFYNIGPIMHETAASILGQSLQRFQWIIVNDGSPNKTLEKETLGRYRTMAQTDPRIVIIDLPENKGLPGARNEGLKFATGKYIILLDPDDMIENTYLEKAVWFLETHPHYTLVNAWSLGFGHKEYYWQKGFQNGDINLKENMITVATVMKTEILKKVGGFDPKLRTGMEDWDLWMRMANNGHWGHTLEEFHFWYRVSPPGKWASIYNETKFNEFMVGQKKKYAVAFEKGVPKLSRPPQEKMESVADHHLLSNRLKKCRQRLLIIIPYMEIGGADQFNYNFAQGLALDGWEITIAANKDAANKWYPQFLRITPDIFIMPRFLKNTDQTRFLTYLIKSRQHDVVFLSNSEGAYHYLSYLRANAPGPAYVDYTHSETPAWKNGGYARYSAGSEPFLDRSIFASEHLRQYCIRLGHNPNKTASVLIGIDSDKYSPKPENRKEIRKELGFPDDVLVIVFVARLESEKQPEVFAEVLNRVNKMGYDFRAISIGGGSLLPDLNETIQRTGLADKVVLLGSIPNVKVGRYVSGSDVFFLPSKVEGISLAIYEAMSQGVCAVSAKVGGQAELVTKDVGYLVVPGTPTEVEEYTEILADLAANPSIAWDLGKKSREKILNGFSVKDTLMKLKQEFCNAAIVSRFTTPLYNNHLMTRISNEVAVLGYEYERASEELLPLWNEYTGLLKRCTPTAPPTLKKIERLPSPFPILTPAEVLENLNLSSLRVVDDILMEKQNVDRKMKIVLKDYQEQIIRKNPKTIFDKFKHNDFLHQFNHEVDNWDDEIPYPFSQQEYIAYIPDAFVGSGDSGTVFDWDRVFLIKKNSKTIFNLPADEYKKCEVISNKKMFSLLQIYFSFGNFIQEQLPKLSLALDEIEMDPEIKILAPNIPFAKDILEGLLKFDPKRMLYFNPGPGWEPCKVYFAQTLIFPTPIPTGHPPKEMMHTLRELIWTRNNISIQAPIDDKSEQWVIYASRTKSTSKQRSISNENEVIESIKSSLPDNMKLYIWDGRESLNQEIIEIASKTKILLGITGSNLSPMIACRPGTIVIEFMHENPWLSWWATSESLLHQYWLLPVKGYTHESENIIIPTDDLIKTIKSSLNNN